MLECIWNFVVLLAVTCTYVHVVSGTASDESCPTWFHHSQEGRCVCGDPVKGIVTCDNVTQSVGVLDCFCMTSNGDKDNTTVVGSFIFNCYIIAHIGQMMIYTIQFMGMCLNLMTGLVDT